MLQVATAQYCVNVLSWVLPNLLQFAAVHADWFHKTGITKFFGTPSCID
jgi:hypothetical protein